MRLFDFATPARRPEYIAWSQEVSLAIEMSQHFDFINVPISGDSDDNLQFPRCDEAEYEMFNEGLVKLPFEYCWFEVDTPPLVNSGEQQKYCFLLVEEKWGLSVYPFLVVNILGVGKAANSTGQRWLIERSNGASPPRYNFQDPFGGAAEFWQEAGETKEAALEIAGPFSELIIYLLVMLSSQSTSTEVKKVDAALNKSRVRKGRAPLPSYRIVNVIPHRVAADIRRELGGPEGGLVRASPRLHWRRSHIRTLQDGRRIPVARSLIGYKAADGREFVDHEYRVTF